MSTTEFGDYARKTAVGQRECLIKEGASIGSDSGIEEWISEVGAFLEVAFDYVLAGKFLSMEWATNGQYKFASLRFLKDIAVNAKDSMAET